MPTCRPARIGVWGEAPIQKMLAAVHYRKEQIVTKKYLDETENKKSDKEHKYFPKEIYLQNLLEAVQKESK